MFVVEIDNGAGFVRVCLWLVTVFGTGDEWHVVAVRWMEPFGVGCRAAVLPAVVTKLEIKEQYFEILYYRFTIFLNFVEIC